MARKRIKQRAAVGALGKQLTRRSRGRCELCSETDEPRLFELPPFPDEPDPERTLVACRRCRTALDTGTLDWRGAQFLLEAIWSELRPVQLAAARLLVACDVVDDPWVRDALEAAAVDPSTGEFTAP